MEFYKIDFQLLIIFSKSFVLEVWMGSEYAFKERI